MGDSGTVLACMTWLIVTATLLGLAGFGTTTINVPSNPYEDSHASYSSSSTSNNIWCILGVTAGAAAGGTGGFLLGFGVGAIVGATLVGSAVGSLACSKVANTVRLITNLVDIAINYLGFLFQLLLFQMPRVPTWLNALIVLPPGLTLGYIGLKGIRGVGG